MLRDVIAALLTVCVGFWTLAVGPFCWILRDGLGPSSVDSHGLYAVVRFLMTFYWGPILLALVVFRVVVVHWMDRRVAQSTEPESPT